MTKQLETRIIKQFREQEEFLKSKINKYPVTPAARYVVMIQMIGKHKCYLSFSLLKRRFTTISVSEEKISL